LEAGILFSIGVESLYFYEEPNQPSSFSGMHSKPPEAAGVVSDVPDLVAVVEVEVPSRRRTLGFTRPYPPSSGF